MKENPAQIIAHMITQKTYPTIEQKNMMLESIKAFCEMFDIRETDNTTFKTTQEFHDSFIQ